jgi:hypothetical protein
MLGQLTLLNKIVLLLLGLLLFVAILYLIRLGKITSQHAVIWILADVFILLFVVSDWLMKKIMVLIGATNPSSTIFFIAIIGFIPIIFDLIIKIAELSNKFRMINQELGLLRERCERLEEKLNQG